jgi:hypothetical protein
MSQQHSPIVEVAAEVPPAAAGETVAVCVFTDGPRLPDAERLGAAVREVCERAVAAGDFKGEEGDALLLHAAATDGAEGGALRVLLVILLLLVKAVLVEAEAGAFGERADEGAGVA